MNSRSILFLLIFILLLNLNQLASAQQFNKPTASVVQKVTLYYNGAAELTPRESATIKRIVEMNITAMIFDGVYQDFDLKDNLIAEGYFHQGRKRGLHTTYFSDRSIKSVIDYLANDFVLWQLKSNTKEDMVLNGTGKFILPFYFASGSILQPRWKQGNLSGEFKFGKREGIWTYFDLANNKLDEEFYENGKFTHRIHYEAGNTIELDYRKDITLSLGTLLEETMAFDQLSFQHANAPFEQSVSYSNSFNRPPTFAGGLKRLFLLMAERVAIPEESRLVLQASINERGFLTSCSVEEAPSKQLRLAASEFVKGLGKKFFPAIKKGKPDSSILYIVIYGGKTGLQLIEALPFDFTQLN